MVVVNLVNSYLGKQGNIGLRTAYIIDNLNSLGIENYSFSRGTVKEYSKNNLNMGLLGHIPRLLNAFRIYINMNYNHRKYDIMLFEKFIELKFKDNENKNKIAHIWEHSPSLIKKFSRKGYITILDVPIAPNSTSKELMKKYGDLIKLHPHEYNLKLERKSYELADYIIAPSSFVKKEILKLGINPEKVFLVPFGANVNQSQEKTFNKNYIKDGIDFCFAGTINTRKGIEFLLEAWNNKVFRNDRLHLCGRLFPEIEEVLRKYKFNNVILPGFVDTEIYFKKCDVYVFPSLLEGSSKSIYEALSSGLPSIVTENSGSIVKNNYTGVIIDVADVDAIKEALLKFKNNPSLIKIMGQRAQKDILNYTWNNYSQNVINVYNKVKEESEIILHNKS